MPHDDDAGYAEEKPKGMPTSPTSGLGCLYTLVGALIIGVPLLIFITLPLFKSGFGKANTRVVNNPRNYDPIVEYVNVLAFASENGEALLIGFNAQQVRSDGKLDLQPAYDHPKPRVDFEFVRPVPRPDNATPIGAGGANESFHEPIDIAVYEPGQWRRSSSSSGGIRTTYTYVNQGMDKDVDDIASGDYTALPAPTCHFATLWAYAIEQGAPAEAVANIGYDKYGYNFRIQGTSFRYKFDIKCQPRG